MKIVVTGTRGFPNVMGGVETHCEELFPRIVQMGIDITVIRRKSYVNDGLSEWHGVKFIDLFAPRKKAFEAIIHTFRAINRAKRLHADVVHIHSIGPALLVPYAKLLGMKVVFTHHGPDYNRKKWGFFAKNVLKLGECMGCTFADEIIVISSVIQDLVKRKFGRSLNVHLVYNGVSSPEFIKDTDYLDEMGLEKGKYIFTMGRFVPEKNFHQLVHAYSRIQCGDCKLVLAGDDDFGSVYSKKLKHFAKENGVILTGYVKGKNLHTLLTHAKGFVLPSSHEGLSISLLEAMTYKLPVIVSDIPANMEIGLDSDSYFHVNDEKQLIEKLQILVQQRFQRKTYDMKNYDWDVIAGKVIDIYKK